MGCICFGSTELTAELFRPIERLRHFMEKHSTNVNNRNGYSLDCMELTSYATSNVEAGGAATIYERRTIESRAELYHLIIRSSQALEALRILAAPQHNFPRLVSSGIRRSERQQATDAGNVESQDKQSSVPLLSAELLEDLTFKNLIITERGGKIVTALLFELMSSLSFDTSNVQELCHDLQLRLHVLFLVYWEVGSRRCISFACSKYW